MTVTVTANGLRVTVTQVSPVRSTARPVAAPLPPGDRRGAWALDTRTRGTLVFLSVLP